MTITTPLQGPRLVTERRGPRRAPLLALSPGVRAPLHVRPGADGLGQGERVWLEDVDGNVFLDFTSGVLVVNAGTPHPPWWRRCGEQADRVVNTYDFVNEWRPASPSAWWRSRPPTWTRR